MCSAFADEMWQSARVIRTLALIAKPKKAMIKEKIPGNAQYKE